MSKDEKTALAPKLRFHEFENSTEWSISKLGDLSEAIEKRAGEKKYTLMSVTSGVGLISQTEKFGREIAGNAYKNYFVIQRGDFAYNKSATKQFPEGYIAMLTDYKEAALPNSIFTCFRITDEDACPIFLNHLFQSNYHGSWLRKFIAVGARAHGSLNIDNKHLWEMPVALPKLPEQQKIADCLSSLDGLIIAEYKKLEALKAHKKGLMQKLFPAEGETVPEWRFPEFRDSGDWETSTLDFLAMKITEKNNDKSINRVLTNSAVNGVIDQQDFFDRDIANRSNLANYYVFDEGDYVYNPRISVTAPVGPISRNNVGKGVISPLYTVFRFKNKSNDYFEHFFKTTCWHQYLKNISNTGARHDRMSISSDGFMNMPLSHPESQKEQQQIADCFSTLDNLITAQTEKIETLKLHKKGLMQGLFPSTREVLE